MEKIQKFVLVEHCTGRKVISSHYDWGTEFTNNELNSLFSENGIQLETTVAYEDYQTPIECGWQSMFNTMWAWMTTSGLSLPLWTYATGVYNYVHNCTIQSDGKTPYEHIYSKTPSIHNLQVWGCIARVHIVQEKRDSNLLTKQNNVVSSDTPTMGGFFNRNQV